VELAKPGTGHVQLVEGALEHLTEEQKKQYPVLHRFQTLVAGMLPGLGWNPRVGLQVRGWLEDAGLQNVSEKIMEIPVGRTNPDKKLGDMAKENLLQVVEHFAEASKGKKEKLAIYQIQSPRTLKIEQASLRIPISRPRNSSRYSKTSKLRLKIAAAS